MPKSPVGTSGAGAGDGKFETGHLLVCGHYSTTQGAIITGPSGKWYRCSEGCGMQKPKRNRKR